MSVLGVPALAIAGRIVALDELWGDAATRRLYARLAHARDTSVQRPSWIARSPNASRSRVSARAPQLALAAAERLAERQRNAVAVDLGVSERHLRRVFRDTVGVSPKTFAKLARFHRALRSAARGTPTASWASIAAAAGYYDQAHLIGEFRAIAGVTPRALLDELRTGWSIGSTCVLTSARIAMVAADVRRDRVLGRARVGRTEAVFAENIARFSPGTPAAAAMVAQTPILLSDPRFDPAPFFQAAQANPALLGHLMGPLVASWDVTAPAPAAPCATVIALGRHDYVVP